MNLPDTSAVRIAIRGKRTIDDYEVLGLMAS